MCNVETETASVLADLLCNLTTDFDPMPKKGLKCMASGCTPDFCSEHKVGEFKRATPGCNNLVHGQTIIAALVTTLQMYPVYSRCYCRVSALPETAVARCPSAAARICRPALSGHDVQCSILSPCCRISTCARRNTQEEGIWLLIDSLAKKNAAVVGIVERHGRHLGLVRAAALAPHYTAAVACRLDRRFERKLCLVARENTHPPAVVVFGTQPDLKETHGVA